jgi:Fur family peroxide stress response transcriptional regulator
MIRELDSIRKLCEKEGIKLTHQRLEILKEISGTREHPTADEIYCSIRQRMPTISLDTVYRTLDRFERMGLISRVEVLDDQVRYDPNTDTHHHLVCVRCKRVEDFCWPAFDRMKAPAGTVGWGRTMRRHVELRGICAQCAKARHIQQATSRRGQR